MTSKISYIKLIREDIRRRGWLAALTGIILFLLMPVYSLLWLDSFLRSVSDYALHPEMFQEQLFTSVPGLISGYMSSFLPVTIFCLAVLSALSGFSFLHSRERLDFFHAFPVKRSQWFSVTCAASFIMFFVPYAVCSALVAAAAASRGVMSAVLAAKCAAAFGDGLLAWLMIFLACVLAVMLTGRTITALLASLAVAVYPFLVMSLFTALKSTFFETFYLSSESITDQLAIYLSPFAVFTALTSSGAQSGLIAARITAAVICAVLLAASFLLYRFYPSEAAGNALSFPATAAVFKVLICIPVSLFFSLMIQNFTGVSGTSWTIGLSMLIVVILCAIIEFIYQQDLRLLLKGWRSSLISIAGTALILIFLQFDLAGYDTWRPAADRVDSISFRPDSFLSYFPYQDTDADNSSPLLYAVFTDDIDPLYQLALSGIENLESGISPQTLYQSPDDSETAENYINAVFCYRMNSGRTVLRQYCIDYTQAQDTLAHLCEDETYRRSLFPIFQTDRDSIHSIAVTDVYGTEQPLHLTKEQQNGLLDAYEKDILSADIQEMDSQTPLGQLTLYRPDRSIAYTTEAVSVDSRSGSGASDTADLISTTGFYIYPDYVHTLDYLKECGYVPRTEIAPGDVESIDLYLSAESVQSGKYDDLLSGFTDSAEYYRTYEDIIEQQITVTAQEDIAEVLEHITPYRSFILKPYAGAPDCAVVNYKTGGGYCEFRLE